jgi:precorrin-2 dehydrogenase/sirohydrochlorin ferrochelatase
MDHAAPRRYLPLFYDLTDRCVVVVGGGKAAAQKVKALLPFEVPVVVVSPAFVDDLRRGAGPLVTLVERRWVPQDLDADPGAPAPGVVLACTDDFGVNDAVVAEARRRGLPVLDASRPARGDFVQPAARKAGTFTLAVSSGGRGPRAAVAVRNALVPAFEAAVDAVSEGAPTPASP